MDAKGVIAAAREVLGEYGQYWIKHAYADPGGFHCMIGAVKNVTNRTKVDPWVVYEELSRRLELVDPDYVPRDDSIGIELHDLIRWNDDPARTWTEVKTLLEYKG